MTESGVYVRTAGKWQLLWKRETASIPLAAGYSGTGTATLDERTVEIYWTCSTSIAAGAAVAIVGAGGIPAAYRPNVQNRPAAVFGSGLPMHAEVGVDGSITVRNAHTSAIPSHRGTATYLLPLT